MDSEIIESPHQENKFFIDSHCHYYPRLTMPGLFFKYVRNVRSTVGPDNFQEHDSIGICLVDLRGNNSFEELITHSNNEIQVSRIDACTLSVSFDDENIRVFKGQQVNSLEGLELIAMGCPKTLPEQLEVRRYIDQYHDQACLVLPWGVGKWIGQRGALLNSLLDEGAPVVLGDNGGRPWWWRDDRLDMDSGRAVLSGSDALPVSTYDERIGTNLNAFTGQFDTCGQWLQLVSSMTTAPVKFGKPNSTFRFLQEQLGIRLR